MYNLQHVDLGYSTKGLFGMGIDTRSAGYDSASSTILLQNLLSQIRRIPGVRAASFSHNGLFTGGSSGDPIEVEGYSPKSAEDGHGTWELVASDYFSTLGVPMLLGRELRESDDGAAPKVCVVTEAFAQRYFNGRNPLGMHITVNDEEAKGVKRTTYQVVGVSKNARDNSLTGKFRALFYMPVAQPASDDVNRASFVIRTVGDRASVLAAARQVVRRTDASLPITYARSVDDQIAPRTAMHRAMAQVAVAFGCIALALAAIGLYGVLSYSVARRRSEIAVRIALGARPRRVIAMVMRETGVVVIAGLILGAGLTYEALGWIKSELYGVAPEDPLTLGFAVAVLLVVALSAVYVPAWRASRLDPVVALRQE